MYIPFIQVAKLPSTLFKGPEEVLLTDDSQGMVIMFASYYLVPEEEVCIQLILTQLAILSLKSIN